jgi:hypothetical protein
MEPFSTRTTAPRIVEKVTFYADNDVYRNKLFTFQVINYVAAFSLLKSFVHKGNYIRAAYLKGHDCCFDQDVLFQLTVSKSFLTSLNGRYAMTPSDFLLSLS